MIIAQTIGWQLFDLQCPSGEWRNLKLVAVTAQGGSYRRSRSRKSIWFLGWNGERLARNTDAGLLAERLPAVYAWAIDVLTRVTDRATEPAEAHAAAQHEDARQPTLSLEQLDQRSPPDPKPRLRGDRGGISPG